MNEKSFDEQYKPRELDVWRPWWLPKFVQRFLFPLLVYDLRPNGWESKTTKIFIPGWIENPLQLKKLMREFFIAGHRVVLVDAPHGVPASRLSDISQPQLRKAMALMQVISELRVNRAVVVTHSEGSIVFAITALMLHRAGLDIFKGAILIEAAGVTGPDTFFQLWSRSQRELKAENWRHNYRPNWYQFWWEGGNFWQRGPGYYLFLTLPWSLAEARGIARTDIRRMLRGLKATGMPIVFVHGDEGETFPLWRVKKSVEFEDLGELVILEGAGHQDAVLRYATYWRTGIKPALQRIEP